MDEETNKAITTLCSSVEAMQDSDFVPGKNPSNKRRKTVLEATNSGDDFDEEERLIVDLHTTSRWKWRINKAC